MFCISNLTRRSSPIYIGEDCAGLGTVSAAVNRLHRNGLCGPPYTRFVSECALALRRYLEQGTDAAHVLIDIFEELSCGMPNVQDSRIAKKLTKNPRRS